MMMMIIIIISVMFICIFTRQIKNGWKWKISRSGLRQCTLRDDRYGVIPGVTHSARYHT